MRSLWQKKTKKYSLTHQLINQIMSKNLKKSSFLRKQKLLFLRKQVSLSACRYEPKKYEHATFWKYFEDMKTFNFQNQLSLGKKSKNIESFYILWHGFIQLSETHHIWRLKLIIQNKLVSLLLLRMNCVSYTTIQRRDIFLHMFSMLLPSTAFHYFKG